VEKGCFSSHLGVKGLSKRSSSELLFLEWKSLPEALTEKERKKNGNV
jgi:hypothetical protein